MSAGESFGEVASELRGGQFAYVSVNTYYYIVTWFDCRPAVPEELDEAAANAIANHGAFADFLADDHDRAGGGAA